MVSSPGLRRFFLSQKIFSSQNSGIKDQNCYTLGEQISPLTPEAPNESNMEDLSLS